MNTEHTVEENEVGTPKDYAHQIIAAFKHLEHGVSYFNGIPCMEAGEEDMMYDLIINALHYSHKEELERARRDCKDLVKIEIIKGYNAEKIELTKMMREMGDEEFHLHSKVSTRMKEVDTKLQALAPNPHSS